MRVDAIFIGIEVDDAVTGDEALAARLTEVCPVDIYARAEGGGVAIVAENVDECVLCRLCLDAAADGVGENGDHGGAPAPVRVLKLYDGGAAL